MSVMALILAQGVASTPGPPAVTWNPADASGFLTLYNSNLSVYKSSGGDAGYAGLRATQARSATDAGGFYFEVLVVGSNTSPFMSIGVANASQVLDNYTGSGTNGWGYYQQTGTKLHAGAGTAYGAAYGTGDVIGVLLKNGAVYFRKNGTWQNSADPDAETGAAFTGLTGSLYPTAALYRTNSPRHDLTGRFKAADFSGSLPTGVSAWES